MSPVYSWCTRGALKYHISAFTLAIRDLTQAIAIDSTCALAYFNRAVCYDHSNQPQKVMPHRGGVMSVALFKLCLLTLAYRVLYGEGTGAHSKFTIANTSPQVNYAYT